MPEQRAAARLDGNLRFKPIGDDRCELFISEAVNDAICRLRQILALTLKDYLSDVLAHTLINLRVFVLNGDAVS
jgi:hypothetical protein